MHKMFFKIIQFLLFSERNFSSENANLKQKKENFMDEGKQKRFEIFARTKDFQ